MGTGAFQRARAMGCKRAQAQSRQVPPPAARPKGNRVGQAVSAPLRRSAQPEWIAGLPVSVRDGKAFC